MAVSAKQVVVQFQFVELIIWAGAYDASAFFWKEKMTDLLTEGIFTRIIFLKGAEDGYGVKSVWRKKPEGGFACVKEWD